MSVNYVIYVGPYLAVPHREVHTPAQPAKQTCGCAQALPGARFCPACGSRVKEATQAKTELVAVSPRHVPGLIDSEIFAVLGGCRNGYSTWAPNRIGYGVNVHVPFSSDENDIPFDKQLVDESVAKFKMDFSEGIAHLVSFLGHEPEIRFGVLFDVN